MPNLGDVMPDFKADTTEGTINFHEWVGNSWAILFSHPADYTPVCTTELGMAHTMAPEFAKRGVKMIALSCDDVKSHNGWITDIKDTIKGVSAEDKFAFPIISDKDRKLAVQLGMIDPDEKDAAGLPLTARAVFVVGPDKKVKLSILYPATTGRNFDEILRVIDSLQLTVNKKVATPANWKSGDEAMVLPSVKPEDVASIFPKGIRQVDMPSKKSYMRFTTDYQ